MKGGIFSGIYEMINCSNPRKSQSREITVSQQDGPTKSPMDGPAIDELLSAYNIEIAKKKPQLRFINTF